MGIFSKKKKSNKVLSISGDLNLSDRTDGLGKATNLVYEYDYLEKELAKLNSIYSYAKRGENKSIQGRISQGYMIYEFGVTTDMLDFGMSQIYKRMREIEKLLNPIKEVEEK